MTMQRLNLRKLWTASLMLYIICSSAFSYGALRMLNTYSLYLFLGISALSIILSGKIKLDISVISIALFGLLLLAGMIYTPTAAGKVQGVVYKYLTMAVIVICIIQYIDSVEDIKNIMFAFMLAGFALAVYVYAQYGSEFWSMMRAATDNEYGYVDRLGIELANANMISLFTMVSVLIAAYIVIFDRTTKTKTILCMVVGIFSFVVSMAAASKKSVLLLLVACVCVWLYNSLGNKNINKQIRNVLILIVCIMLFVWLINTLPIFSGIASRMRSLFESFAGGGTLSELNRMAFIEYGLDIWEENPLFGAGTAASIYYFGVYTHNNVIEILMSTGIVGLFLFYGAYPVACYKYLVKARAYKAIDKLSILLFALFVSISPNMYISVAFRGEYPSHHQRFLLTNR